MELNRIVAATCIALVVSILGPAGLQAQQQYGELVVRVTDQTGGVMPGATVILTSDSLIRPVEGVTEDSGTFRYRVLPAGLYSVTVSAPGFSTAVQDEVTVDIGRTYSITLSLDVASVEETVTVTATSPVVDTVRSESAGVFKGDNLVQSPGARDYTRFAAYMPSVNVDFMVGNDTSGVKGGDAGQANNGSLSSGVSGISVDGSSGAENVFYVDGIDTTSMYTGMSNQGVRTEMVQELQVKTAGYEAQYGGAMGGVMSVVTKSGSNRFRGSGVYYFSGSALNGEPRQRLRLDPDSAVDVAEYVQDPEDKHVRNEFGFTLGGPIFRDRAWFFASLIPQYGTRERNVVFTTGESGSYRRDDKMLNFLGKIDYQPYTNVKVNGSFATDTFEHQGDLPSLDGTDNYDFAWDDKGFTYPSYTYMITSSVIPNPDFLMDFRFGSNHLGTDQALQPVEPRHLFLQSNGLIGFSQDHPLYRPRNWNEYGYYDGYITKDDQNKSTLAASASYFVQGGGQHNLKLGYQFNRLGQDIDNSYKYDYIRLYYGQPYTTLQGEPATSSCTGPDGVVYTPCGYYEARAPFGTLADIHTDRHAFYVQDGWTIGNRVTLNLGIRLEKEAIPSFSDLPEFQGVAYQWDFFDKAAPRVGTSFDVLGDGTLKAFGSWGWFYDAMKLEMANGSFGGFKWWSQYYLIDDSNFDWTRVGGLNGDGPYPGTFIEAKNWRPVSFEDLDPDLLPMRMTEIVGGLEWEVRPRTALSFRFVHKNLDQAIEDVGRLTPEGESYYITNPGRGYSVSKFLEAGLPPTPRAERTYRAAEIRFQKRFGSNWSADASYTYSRLRGLYSGLGSSDENGRLSPNVVRDFDLWYLNYDAHGNFLSGPLNTDRPHQVKASGTYTFPFGLNVAGFFRVMSGNPISRTVNFQGMDVLVENRMSDGRNPVWSQLDLFVSHSFQPFADAGKRIEVNFNVINVLNRETAVRTFRSMYRHELPLWHEGEDPGIVLNGYDYEAIAEEQGVPMDPRFLKPDRFISPIQARFGVKFIF